MPEFLVEEAKSAGPYSAPPSRRSSGGFGGRDYREGYSRGGLGARGGGAVGGKGLLHITMRTSAQNVLDSQGSSMVLFMELSREVIQDYRTYVTTE